MTESRNGRGEYREFQPPQAPRARSPFSKLKGVSGLGVFAGAFSLLAVVVALGGASAFSEYSSKLNQQSMRKLAVVSTGTDFTGGPIVDRTIASSSPGASSPESLEPAVTKAANTGFKSPNEAEMPTGEYGKIVKLGEQIFNDPKQYASRFVGNDLSCANCHLDAGRKENSAPLWGAFIHYPAFRSKTGIVDTLASRIQGCFEFSMNGKSPPQDDEVMTALQTYAFWLAKGAPVGTPVEGSGYLKLKKPQSTASRERGEKVYVENCALCHGSDGLGQRAGGEQVFPPLWGPKSFNWGAGMHQIGNAAGFIKANMPLGKGGTLTDQQSWDVATYMNSHERPQDPRFKGNVAETRKIYHDSDDSLYGTSVDGHILGGK
jgi:thiosulfate dehydrogenase